MSFFNSVESALIQLLKATGNKIIGTDSQGKLVEKYIVGLGPHDLLQLDAEAFVPDNVIRHVAINDVKVFDTQTELLAWSTAKVGDVGIIDNDPVHDNNGFYMLRALPPKTLANWKETILKTGIVKLNGLTGVNITIYTGDMQEGKGKGTVVHEWYTDQRVAVAPAIKSLQSAISGFKIKNAADTTTAKVSIDGGILKITVPVTGAKKYKKTFTNTNLTSGQITISHKLNYQYCSVVVADNSKALCFPDIVFNDTETLTLDFSNLIPISGTYTVSCMG